MNLPFYSNLMSFRNLSYLTVRTRLKEKLRPRWEIHFVFVFLAHISQGFVDRHWSPSIALAQNCDTIDTLVLYLFSSTGIYYTSFGLGSPQPVSVPNPGLFPRTYLSLLYHFLSVSHYPHGSTSNTSKHKHSESYERQNIG